MKNVLIITKGPFDSGNYQTAFRIKNLINGNYNAKIVQEEDINLNFEPHLYIVIHLGRYVDLVKRIPKRSPLVSIISGTDLNSENYPLEDIDLVVRRSRFIVSLSKSLAKKFSLIWPDLSPRLKVIYQSINLEYFSNIPLTNQFKEEKYFIFCGRLRSIKDPKFCLEGFMQWKKYRPHSSYKLIILGSKEDDFDIEHFLSGNEDISWMESVHRQMAHELIRNSVALINTSRSEGQCLTIMEAFLLNTPVIARRNEGNTELIGSDGERGFLFADSIQSFVDCLNGFVADYELSKERITEKTEKAKTFISHDVFSANTEKSAYMTLINTALHSP